MQLRLFLVVLIALGLWVWPSVVRADPQQQLDLATSRFDNARYEEAAEILAGLLSIRADPDTPEGKLRFGVYLRARPYYAACLIALSRGDEADAVILEQYRADPHYEPPTGQFPQPVTDRFFEVAARNRKLIEDWKAAVIDSKQQEAAQKAALEKARNDRLATLERMAAEEKYVKSRSRWLAMVPFGVGQFQNENVGLGIFFAASETLALTSTVVSFVIADTKKDVRCPGVDENGVKIICEDLMTQFEIARAVNWISFGTSIALLVGGIIEAQVSFEDERVEMRKRPIPPPVKVAPVGAVTPDGGAWLGVDVRF